MTDLAAVFDAHVAAEFQDLDLEATMATMGENPYVHHVPTVTGGTGAAGVRHFYGNHFIGQWPDDTETRQLSRTVGETQVVDELLMTFTHDPAHLFTQLGQPRSSLQLRSSASDLQGSPAANSRRSRA